MRVCDRRSVAPFSATPPRRSRRKSWTSALVVPAWSREAERSVVPAAVGRVRFDPRRRLRSERGGIPDTDVLGGGFGQLRGARGDVSLAPVLFPWCLASSLDRLFPRATRAPAVGRHHSGFRCLAGRSCPRAAALRPPRLGVEVFRHVGWVPRTPGGGAVG